MIELQNCSIAAVKIEPANPIALVIRGVYHDQSLNKRTSHITHYGFMLRPLNPGSDE